MTKFRDLTRADILPMERYERERRDHRKRISALKQNRRVEVGPHATFYFENFDTMWHQVHEMLAVERGGEPQIVDELAAYNPLIPKGSELVATVMFEIEDPVQRDKLLRRLGGVEHKVYLAFAGEKVRGEADPTRENTSPEGKASSVQFLRFPFTPEQKAKFKAPGTQVMAGIEHADYGHMAVLSEATRQALAGDFA
ncbi:MAG TPA: DUF3501 family protein [Stellaceae bacterium]|jgi:hypothetical protein|nr:DUF3501 family protein [Stellaceae bacterium]